MLNNHYFFNLITVGLLLIGAEPTLAQPAANGSARSDNSITRVSFEPPPDDKQPDRTAGAGSRGGQCPQDATVPTANTPPLMALVPTTNRGLTLAERPTFYVYLPETSAKQVALSIKEEGTKYHSQTFFPITGTSGIISLKPSDNSPPLEVGKNYQWAMVLLCDERPNPNDPAIASWVRRVALSKPTNQGTALQQAAWYGQNGVWYDALASLAEARRIQSNNKALTDDWTNLLKSAGLGPIATEPIQVLHSSTAAP
ncbi:MAG: DUF928 domain-containing protein [Gloeobacterales cyanobacterium]